MIVLQARGHALEPILLACNERGLPTLGNADREVVDERDRLRVRPISKLHAAPLWLSDEEDKGY